MVQVDLEETDDATFDVGTPSWLRGVERDLANGAHGPTERERSVDMLLTLPMVQGNGQTNGEREVRVKSPSGTDREPQGNTI